MSQRAVEVRKREGERNDPYQLGQFQDLNWTSQCPRAEIKCREDQRPTADSPIQPSLPPSVASKAHEILWHFYSKILISTTLAPHA